MPLATRLASTRDRIAAAARRSGRSAADVRLVAVTKASPPSRFDELVRAGVRDCGENRVQGAAERLAGYEQSFRWHFIGHLQSNKARAAAALFNVFHGVDSLNLLRRLDRVAGELGRSPELLLQVNVSGEGSKAGVEPARLPELLAEAAGLEHARVVGLMTMAPRVAQPEDARPFFAGLAELAAAHGPPGAPVELSELSMGMSQDFEVAVEEGATLVRIGRSLLPPPEVQ